MQTFATFMQVWNAGPVHLSLSTRRLAIAVHVLCEGPPVADPVGWWDPVAYIMSSNDKRRHMKLGQRAMIAAKVALVLNTTHGKAAKNASVSREYVILGNKPLNEAYAMAQERKAEMESEEGKMERLRKHAIDLADLIAEELMSIIGSGLESRRFSIRAPG